MKPIRPHHKVCDLRVKPYLLNEASWLSAPASWCRSFSSQQYAAKRKDAPSAADSQTPFLLILRTPDLACMNLSWGAINFFVLSPQTGLYSLLAYYGWFLSLLAMWQNKTKQIWQPEQSIRPIPESMLLCILLSFVLRCHARPHCMLLLSSLETHAFVNQHA